MLVQSPPPGRQAGLEKLNRYGVDSVSCAAGECDALYGLDCEKQAAVLKSGGVFHEASGRVRRRSSRPGLPRARSLAR